MTTKTRDLRRSWHQIECPYCAASSWAKCRTTPSGRLLAKPHAARLALAERNPHQPDPPRPVSDAAVAAAALNDFNATIVKAIPQLRRGLVWCKRCRREQSVQAAAALRLGWPTCHGQTMTIDAPSTW